MKRFSEQLKNKSNSIRLRATERADLRDRIESYMEYHPLPAHMKEKVKRNTRQARKKKSAIASEPFKAIPINMTYVRGLVGAFALIVIVVVPVLAEYTVPGDILYPVKTNLNEELRSSLTFSPYAKVQWETKLLERRIAEARQLARDGKFTPEVEQSVAQAIVEHTDAAATEISSLRENDADKAALAEIAFASALSVQADVLTDAQEEVEEDSNESHSIAVLTDILADVSGEVGDSYGGGSDISYESLLALVEAETTRAYELFESIKTAASPQEVEDIKRRFDDLERKITQAAEIHKKQLIQTENDENISLEEDTEQQVVSETDIELPANASTTATSSEVIKETDVVLSEEKRQEQKDAYEHEAVSMLRTVLSDLQKLIIFMTDIDVRSEISIETLIPVTPTFEEEKEAAWQDVEKLRQMQMDIEDRIGNYVRDEKLLYGAQLLAEKVAEITTLLEEENISQAQQNIHIAYALVEDVQRMLDTQPRGQIEEKEITVTEDTEGPQNEQPEQSDEEPRSVDSENLNNVEPTPTGTEGA